MGAAWMRPAPGECGPHSPHGAAQLLTISTADQVKKKAGQYEQGPSVFMHMYSKLVLFCGDFMRV